MPPPERSLHVLALSRALPFHGIGGMQAIAWDIFRELVRIGHRVSVITTAIVDRPERFDSDGVQVIQLPAAPAEKYSRTWWRDADLRALDLHRRVPVDAVLSISAAAADMPQFRHAAPRVGFLFQAHGTSWGEFESKWRSGRPLQWLKSAKNLYWLFKDALVYRRFDEIVMVGDVLERQFARWPMTWIAGTVPRRLIRNGVDTEVFRPDAAAGAAARRGLNIPADASVVVCAARLHPQKGVRQLLDAFFHLAADDPAAHLLVVGGGEAEAGLRSRAAASPAAARIRFTGAVTRDAVPGLLAAAQVFAFPSLRQEGLPMNVLEALACGLPAVVSESMRGVFAPGLAIAYADPLDPARLGAALAQALRDTQAPPRSLLADDYTLTRCVDAYVQCLGTPRS